MIYINELLDGAMSAYDLLPRETSWDVKEALLSAECMAMMMIAETRAYQIFQEDMRAAD